MSDSDLLGRIAATGTDGDHPTRHSPREILSLARRAKARRRRTKTAYGLGVALGLVSLLAGPAAVALPTSSALGGFAFGSDDHSEVTPEGKAADAEILRKTLGSEFDIEANASGGTLRAGSPSAASLPRGYTADFRFEALTNGADWNASACSNGLGACIKPFPTGSARSSSGCLGQQRKKTRSRPPVSSCGCSTSATTAWRR